MLHGVLAVIVTDIQELEDYHIAVDVVAAALAVSMAVVVATFVIVAGAVVLLKYLDSKLGEKLAALTYSNLTWRILS